MVEPSVSEYLFSEVDDAETQTTETSLPPWRVLVVDDDQDIHHVTRLVLSNFEFEHRYVELTHVYSAQEAIELLEQDSTFAVALVDVVMETNHAGLMLIKHIREQIDNHDIRLILRTGQPGEAPEESIIRDYDINDYKNKTELTAIKLKTLVYSALRGYRDIQLINRQKQGLERIINASTVFLKCDSIHQFASVVLNNISHILGLEDAELYCAAVTYSSNQEDTEFKLLAASGHPPESDISKLPHNVRQDFHSAHQRKRSIKNDSNYVGYFPGQNGMETMLYVDRGAHLNTHEHQLLEFFANNVALAYNNLKLRETVRESQKELSYILGEAVEKRSKETGSHVKRVANYSYLLATLYGLSDYQVEVLKLASPLHDIGKISIPDHILNKPGKLNDQEWEIMQQHAQVGYEILHRSSNEILQCGAIIAGQHHEKWDGSGYPKGLAKEAIHIVGRITALADVFDALGSERCYKKAWPMEDIIDFIEQQKGHHFDPTLVELMIKNIDEFIAIKNRYPD
ncbi:response regulator [Pseudoalteromonas sp. SW0106-04]|nr:response regulator [Pseudoalteromonas sp. SW0106-04]